MVNPGDLHVRRSLWLAFVVSLTLHSAVLFIGYSSSLLSSGSAGDPDDSSPPRPRLLATLATQPTPATRLQVAPSRPSETAPVSPTRKLAQASPKQAEQKSLSAPRGVWANRSWSNAERADMNKFLDELATEAKPASGQELSKRSLAMARQMVRSPQDDGVDEKMVSSAGNSTEIEPYSLEMYFDAFLRKLNRSAAFVKREPRPRGLRKALVEISLNANGSLKGYRVLRSADQDAEIAYIKSIIERASPFSAFPPDIRKASDSLSILMCIYPAYGGQGGGFSRSSGAQDCKD